MDVEPDNAFILIMSSSVLDCICLGTEGGKGSRSRCAFFIANFVEPLLAPSVDVQPAT